ncbi:MAG: alpha/beta fold hydrolase [Candidatus Velamenicoccus archaeovorus]
MSEERLALRLADGRALEVAVAGPPDGTVLVFHHGSPGSATLFEPFTQACAERGLRFVTFSRAGFGDSSRLPGRTVASAAVDVAELADHLGVDRFHVVGWSGGGPHALACAALLPDRVISAATLAGVAPWDAEGLDWTAGMGEDNRVEYPTAARDPEELLRWMQPHVEALSNVTAEGIVEDLRTILSDVDVRSLTGAFGGYQAELFRGAFRNGVWGWYDDDLAFTRPWGFALADIEVPVSIWQGPEDLMVPFAHGEWLAAHVPGARAHLEPGQGHLSLVVEGFGRILDDLIASGRG